MLNRVISMNVPALGNYKLKYRSGSTSALRTRLSYTSADKPYNFTLYDKDSAVEEYQFRYGSSGKLERMITVINPVDNKPPTYRSTDVFQYDNDNYHIISIQRTSSDLTKQGTYTIQFSGAKENGRLGKITFKNYSWDADNCPSGCNDNMYRWSNGGKIEVQSSGPGGNLSGFLNDLRLQDVKSPSLSTDFDTYYFHPLMFLQSHFTNGPALFLTYMIDWWSPGAAVSPREYKGNYFVSINYQYGL